MSWKVTFIIVFTVTITTTTTIITMMGIIIISIIIIIIIIIPITINIIITPTVNIIIDIVVIIEQYCCLMQAVGGVAVHRGALKLGQLAADVQALRDVKHFVKDYKGHMLPADYTTGRQPGVMLEFSLN